jgi:AcrR family transcriptional regulator
LQHLEIPKKNNDDPNAILKDMACKRSGARQSGDSGLSSSYRYATMPVKSIRIKMMSDSLVHQHVTQSPGKKVERDTFHHGDLRRALLTSAWEVVEEYGVARTSLREVARRNGVAASSALHHFGDKMTLLAAVAEEGFRQLTNNAAAAAEGITDRKEHLRQFFLAYVRFALSQRNAGNGRLSPADFTARRFRQVSVVPVSSRCLTKDIAIQRGMIRHGDCMLGKYLSRMIDCSCPVRGMVLPGFIRFTWQPAFAEAETARCRPLKPTKQKQETKNENGTHTSVDPIRRCHLAHRKCIGARAT